jgi:hypothetical protein
MRGLCGDDSAVLLVVLLFFFIFYFVIFWVTHSPLFLTFFYPDSYIKEV